MHKEKLSLQISFILVVVTIFIYVLHNIFSIGHSLHQLNFNETFIAISTLLPLFIYIITLFHYKWGKSLSVQQYLNMLVATFCSMGMITAGHGMVEYHFSIFMVLAIISYYEKVMLILAMTLLFVIQHLVGFFFMTPYVFGVMQGEYSFGMLLYHALFLLATSGALIWQIIHKKRLRRELNIKIEEQQQLASVLFNMQMSSEQLFNATKQLQNLYDNTTAELQDINHAINGISSDMKHHSQVAKETSLLVEHIVEGLEHISDANNKVVDRAEVMSKRANDGEILMDKTLIQMKHFENQCHHYSSEISKLNNLTEHVGVMAEVIQHIAKQTKLLSINASIEAASAGIHGRGFSVVANQIGKLAEDSSQSAKQIKNLLLEIDKATKESVGNAESLLKQVSESVHQNKDMVAILHEINELINESTEQFSLVSDSIEGIVASTQQANVAVMEMSKLAEKINEQTFEAASSANNQQKNIESLSPFIQTLINISKRLIGIVEK